MSTPPQQVTLAQTIPSTQLADALNFTGLICPVDTYRFFTQDNATEGPQLQRALKMAELDICRKCNRTLKFGHYYERAYVSRNGYVWPSATPIHSILNPAGTYQQGSGIWVGFYLPLPEMPFWSGIMPPQTNVEYYGGYTDEDGLYPPPPRLQRLIAKVAWYLVNPVSMPGLPPGATNSSVGGISVSGDLSTLMARDPEMKRDVAAFTRPQLRAWQT